MKLLINKVALLIVCLIVSGSPVVLFADEEKKAPASVEKQLTKEGRRVQIEADNLVVYKKESRIVFTGNVVLKSAPTTISCEKLTAYYREEDRAVKKAVCVGNVKVVHADTFAHCEKATFDNTEGLITMEGKPVIYQGNQVFRGDLLKYRLEDEKITGKNVEYRRKPEPAKMAPKGGKD